MLALKDRTVVITGGATGIGFALAKACGKQGAQIVIGEPREAQLQRAVSELGDLGIEAKACPCDVAEPQAVEAFADFAFQAYGEVALVLNNAGVSQQNAKVLNTPLEELHRVFDVNFFGVWHGCKVFGQRLADQGAPAAIYNTGSENSYFVAVRNSAAYVASKHAVYGLTDALRGEMPDYISVGLITPGFVGSELIPKSFRDRGMPPAEFADIALAQIRAGEFYVVSHGYNQVRIDERYQEVSSAFSTYAARQDGDEKYDVQVMMSRR